MPCVVIPGPIFSKQSSAYWCDTVWRAGWQLWLGRAEEAAVEVVLPSREMVSQIRKVITDLNSQA